MRTAWAASLLLVFCLAASAGEPGELARIHDPNSRSTDRHRAFLNLISRLDSALRAFPESSPAISHCAAYTFLFSELYELNGREIEPTLEEAVIYLGTPEVIFQKMLGNSGYLVGPLESAREHLLTVMTGAFNRGLKPGHLDGAGAADLLRLEQETDPEKLSEYWKRFQSLAAGRLAGLEQPVQLPLWLTTHSGTGPLGNPDPRDDRQGRKWGYLQLPGDLDATGRHDHTIGTMILGYSAERAKMAVTHEECQECSRSTPPEIERLARIFRQLRPDAWLNTLMRDAAPYADEYLSSDQNSSPTDALVNRRGQALGAWLAHPSRRMTPLELNRRLFANVCDESSARPLIPGPLTEQSLGAATHPDGM